MIFDVHLVIPMGKKHTKKNMLWWSKNDLNFDGPKKIDPSLQHIMYEMKGIKNPHFTTVKHWFFSKSMIQIDVLSENLLPLA